MRQQAGITLPESGQNGAGASILGPHTGPLELGNCNLLASPEGGDGRIPIVEFWFCAARNQSRRAAEEEGIAS